MKIVHYKKKCIGCGSCVAMDPSNWEMHDGIARLKDAQRNEETDVKETENAKKDVKGVCPVEAIDIN